MQQCRHIQSQMPDASHSHGYIHLLTSGLSPRLSHRYQSVCHPLQPDLSLFDSHSYQSITLGSTRCYMYVLSCFLALCTVYIKICSTLATALINPLHPFVEPFR